MQGTASPTRRTLLRTVLILAAGGIAGLALFTCTPPNFEPPEPELVLSPQDPAVPAGGQLAFTATGGTPPYAFSLSSGPGSVAADTGLYDAPALPGSAAVMVTDLDGETAQTSVTILPGGLVVSPISLSIFLGSSVTLSVSGGTPATGTPPYTVSIDHGGTLDWIDGTTTWSFLSESEGDHTVTVVDSSVPPKTVFSAIKVSSTPTTLTIVPDQITLRVGETCQFNAEYVEGTAAYSMVDGVGEITTGGFYTATGVGHAIVKVSDTGGHEDTADVDVIDPAEWNVPVPVDDKSAGYLVSLAIDSYGDPQIAYWEGVGKDLKAARWTGSSWEILDVDPDLPNEQKQSSLAIDGSGTAHVAWHKADLLYYNTNDGTEWDPLQTQTVASSKVGPYVSLALDGDAHPRIAYYDDTLGNLRYVERDGSAWLPAESADSSMYDVGQYASLALNASGEPRIAYYDADNTRLMYVEKSGASWGTPVVVDDEGDVGQHASLRLNDSGNPCIAYYDATNDDLKYAEKIGAWASWTVESAGDVGQYASLALDPSDQHPHIAFYDATNGNLRYAAWNGELWVIAAVDEGANGGANDVGRYASLALDPDTGAMKIAYQDTTAFDLLYITEQPQP